MHRIDSATAEADKFGTGKDGWTEGEPDATLPTQTTEDWFDGVQEEICNVVESADVTLIKNTRDQLYDAIMFMMRRAAIMDMWQPMTNPKLFTLRSVIYDSYSDYLFACGVADGADAYMLRSINAGMDWSEMANPVNTDLYGMASNGAGTIVAVGKLDAGSSYVISSTNDGGTWTRRTISGVGYLYGVVWAENLFVAVGREASLAQINTSPDGITWTRRTYSSTEGLYAVTHSPDLGLFCAVGDNYSADTKAATSPDGVTWTERSTGITPGNFYSVCWSEFLQLFVAVGQDIGNYPLIGTSPDGITWTARTTGLIDISGDLNAVISLEDARVLLAVGQHTNNNSIQGFISRDGISWTYHNIVVNGGIGNMETARSAALAADQGAVIVSGGAVGGSPIGATLIRVPYRQLP